MGNFLVLESSSTSAGHAFLIARNLVSCQVCSIQLNFFRGPGAPAFIISWHITLAERGSKYGMLPPLSFVGYNMRAVTEPESNNSSSCSCAVPTIDPRRNPSEKSTGSCTSIMPTWNLPLMGWNSTAGNNIVSTVESAERRIDVTRTTSLIRRPYLLSKRTSMRRMPCRNRNGTMGNVIVHR